MRRGSRIGQDVTRGPTGVARVHRGEHPVAGDAHRLGVGGLEGRCPPPPRATPRTARDVRQLTGGARRLADQHGYNRDMRTQPLTGHWPATDRPLTSHWPARMPHSNQEPLYLRIFNCALIQKKSSRDERTFWRMLNCTYSRTPHWPPQPLPLTAPDPPTDRPSPSHWPPQTAHCPTNRPRPCRLPHDRPSPAHPSPQPLPLFAPAPSCHPTDHPSPLTSGGCRRLQHVERAAAAAAAAAAGNVDVRVDGARPVRVRHLLDVLDGGVDGRLDGGVGRVARPPARLPLLAQTPVVRRRVCDAQRCAATHTF